MSLVLQNSLSNSIHLTKLFFPITNHFNLTKPPNFSIFHNPFQSLSYNFVYPFHKNLYFPIKANNSYLNSIDELEISSPKSSTFDAFLSLIESLCVISSIVISVGCVVNLVCLKQNNSGLFVFLGSKVLVWLLASAVAVGSVIRRRQWSRVCGSGSRSKVGFESGNLIDRIEKLEESMRSASSIIRMLSRQVEKLGIRFRVTRKAMKDPISETAALAQKNSEATRALVAQDVILEKELAEVQNVLLAMQDQQQKQLELILVLAKRGNLLENKRDPNQGPNMSKIDSSNSTTEVDGQPIQGATRQMGATNNQVLGS